MHEELGTAHAISVQHSTVGERALDDRHVHVRAVGVLALRRVARPSLLAAHRHPTLRARLRAARL